MEGGADLGRGIFNEKTCYRGPEHMQCFNEWDKVAEV